MTTGSRVTDSRSNSFGHMTSRDNNGVLIYDGPYGLHTSGVYSSKTWSGDDAPKAIRQQLLRTIRLPRPGLSGSIREYRLWDTNIPKSKVQRGFHAYQMSSIYEDNGGGGFSECNNLGATTVKSGLSGSFFLGGFPYPAWPAWGANEDIALINQLGVAFKGGQFNAAVFLGEGHQALQMITDSATRLYKAYKATRKGDFPSAFRALVVGRPPLKGRKAAHWVRESERRTSFRASATPSVSSRWLELQYGWTPLISDMYNAAELFANRVHRPFVKRYYASMRRRNVLAPNPGAYEPVSSSAVIKKQIVAYIAEAESVPKFLGLTNPELVAWELLPFSFVADWFVPFGSFLEARATFSALTGTFITTKTYEASVNGVKHAPVDLGYSVVSYNGGASLRGLRKDVNRTVGYSISVPFPEVKPLAKALSVKHCLNAIALLGSS